MLSTAFVHVSKYSGAIIEASQMGVYSIIIDKLGVETFKSFISRGDAFALDNLNSESFNKLLVKINNNPNTLATKQNIEECMECFYSIQ